MRNAECKAGLRPAPSDSRTIREIDRSLCEFNCGLVGPGGPLPASWLSKKLVEWALKSAGTKGACTILCGEST